MLCDDCCENQAVLHAGNGICLCDNCAANCSLLEISQKIKERDLAIQKLADGEYVDFEILKRIPVKLIRENM